MPQDAFTLKHLTKQLNNRFKGGKINKIIQPENEKVVLTVWMGKGTEKLYLDVNPASPKIGVFNSQENVPLTAPNFCMLLRKHLQNATIIDITLPIFDRIVKIDLVQKGDFFDDAKKTLFVELMGRYSNIILTENGKVLGGNRGINFFDNGVRPLIVNRPYVYPPTNDKKQPNDVTLIDDFINQNPDSVSSFIASNIQGISSATAKEIESRFSSSDSEQRVLAERARRLYDFINEFIENSTPNPCVYFEKGKAVDVCVMAYQTIESEPVFFEDLITAEAKYFSVVDEGKKFAQKKDKLQSIITALIKKNKRKLTTLNARDKDASSADENRLKGELLLANIYRIKKGEKQVELDNYYDNTKVKITLDENLDVSKNAERYYKKYNKQKRTLEALIPQKEQAKREEGYLCSVLEEISLAENVFELNLIESELEKQGLIKENKKSTKKQEESISFNEYEIDGYVVKSGRNNIENDKLTFTSKPLDIWVHAKDYHSAHVIIETNGKSVDSVPLEVIVKACEISAYYSKAREGGKCEVSYTQKKNVKKPPKSKPGFCTYTDFKSLMVNANKHEELLKNK